MTAWRSVQNDPPPDGVVVEVQNNGGAKLVKQDGLWFLPDFSMYVYYTPEFWRELPVETHRRYAYHGRGHDHYWCAGCTDDCEFGPCCALETVELVPADEDVEAW